MRVAGGKLDETKHTHRIEWKGVRAPAGRMKWSRRLASCASLGRETFWRSVRWVRLSLRSRLPIGYLHWPRWGRKWAVSVFYCCRRRPESGWTKVRLNQRSSGQESLMISSCA